MSTGVTTTPLKGRAIAASTAVSKLIGDEKGKGGTGKWIVNGILGILFILMWLGCVKIGVDVVRRMNSHQVNPAAMYSTANVRPTFVWFLMLVVVTVGGLLFAFNSRSLNVPYLILVGVVVMANSIVQANSREFDRNLETTQSGTDANRYVCRQAIWGQSDPPRNGYACCYSSDKHIQGIRDSGKCKEQLEEWDHWDGTGVVSKMCSFEEDDKGKLTTNNVCKAVPSGAVARLDSDVEVIKDRLSIFTDRPSMETAAEVWLPWLMYGCLLLGAGVRSWASYMSPKFLVMDPKTLSQALKSGNKLEPVVKEIYRFTDKNDINDMRNCFDVSEFNNVYIKYFQTKMSKYKKEIEQLVDKNRPPVQNEFSKDKSEDLVRRAWVHKLKRFYEIQDFNNLSLKNKEIADSVKSCGRAKFEGYLLPNILRFLFSPGGLPNLPVQMRQPQPPRPPPTFPPALPSGFTQPPTFPPALPSGFTQPPPFDTRNLWYPWGRSLGQQTQDPAVGQHPPPGPAVQQTQQLQTPAVQQVQQPPQPLMTAAVQQTPAQPQAQPEQAQQQSWWDMLTSFAFLAAT